MSTFQKIITNPLVLKINALIIAIGVWFFLNQTHSMIFYCNVPLCFYNQSENQSIDSPETIQICLKGHKNDFYRLSLDNLALHYDSSYLHDGVNTLVINDSNLFLPQEIKLLHYSPSNIVVKVKKI